MLGYHIKSSVWVVVTVLLCMQDISVNAQNASSSYMSDCYSWNQTAQSVLTSVDLNILNVSCSVITPSCSGFKCHGSLGVASYGINKRIQFGLEFVACREPINMVLYVIVEDMPWRRTLILNNSSPMSNYVLPAIVLPFNVSVTPNASIYFAAASQPGRVTVEMNVTMNISSPINKQVVLNIVPRREVSVPPCTTQLPFTIPTMQTRPLTPEPPSRLSGPGTSCVPSTMHQCNNYQQCYNSTCMCMSDYNWNGKTCVSKDDEVATTPNSGNGTDNASPTLTNEPANNHTLIIILSCIGVALGLGVMVAVIRCRYVRYRQRYGQHDLLVNEADNNLDEVDPPMIEA